MEDIRVTFSLTFVDYILQRLDLEVDRSSFRSEGGLVEGVL